MPNPRFLSIACARPTPSRTRCAMSSLRSRALSLRESKCSTRRAAGGVVHADPVFDTVRRHDLLFHGRRKDLWPCPLSEARAPARAFAYQAPQ